MAPGANRDLATGTGLATVLVAVTCVAVTAGCDSGPPSPEMAGTEWMDATSPDRRDSAGVTIITHTLDCLDDLPLIQLDTTPLLSIGEAEGPPGISLHQVRDAITRPDGSIVVADDGGTVLREYAPDGQLLGSHGRRGPGPGEYTGIIALGNIQGDSLVVYDISRNSRISVLDPQFQFARSIPLPAPFGLAGPGRGPHVLETPDAVWLERERGRPQPGERFKRDPYIRQDTLSLIMLRTESSPVTVDTLLRPPGVTMEIQERESGASGRGVTFGAMPFLAGNTSGFAFAHGSRFEVLRYDPRANLRQVVRLAVRPREVTAEDRKPREDAFRRRTADQPPGSTRDRPPVFADYHPPLAGMMLDAAGNLWARSGTALTGDGKEWLVLGPDGEPRAWYSGLPGIQGIFHLDEDNMLVRRRGRDGTERVVQYRIQLP